MEGRPSRRVGSATGRAPADGVEGLVESDDTLARTASVGADDSGLEGGRPPVIDLSAVLASDISPSSASLLLEGWATPLLVRY